MPARPTPFRIPSEFGIRLRLEPRAAAANLNPTWAMHVFPRRPEKAPGFYKFLPPIACANHGNHVQNLTLASQSAYVMQVQGSSGKLGADSAKCPCYQLQVPCMPRSRLRSSDHEPQVTHLSLAIETYPHTFRSSLPRERRISATACMLVLGFDLLCRSCGFCIQTARYG